MVGLRPGQRMTNTITEETIPPWRQSDFSRLDAAALRANRIIDRLPSFLNHATSDLKITCGARDWNVHRLVLALHSEVMKSVFRNGKFKEANDGIFDFSDTLEHVIDALVTFMYKHDYELKVPKIEEEMERVEGNETESTAARQVTEPVGPLSFHILMLLLANQYDMPHLEEVAASKFQATLWTDIAFEVKDLELAVLLAYNEGGDVTEDQRKALVNFAVDRHEKFSKLSEELVESAPAFALDIIEEQRVRASSRIRSAWH